MVIHFGLNCKAYVVDSQPYEEIGTAPYAHPYRLSRKPVARKEGMAGLMVRNWNQLKGGIDMLLISWIKDKGMSQQDFHEFARENGSGYSIHSVYKWCNGKRIPRPDEMQLIHKITDGQVSANDFYGLH